MEGGLAALTGAPLPALTAFDVLPGQTVPVEVQVGEEGHLAD